MEELSRESYVSGQKALEELSENLRSACSPFSRITTNVSAVPPF